MKTKKIPCFSHTHPNKTSHTNTHINFNVRILFHTDTTSKPTIIIIEFIIVISEPLQLTCQNRVILSQPILSYRFSPFRLYSKLLVVHSNSFADNPPYYILSVPSLPTPNTLHMEATSNVASIRNAVTINPKYQNSRLTST